MAPRSELLRSASERVVVGAWCRDNDVDAWFDQAATCASRPASASTTWAAQPSGRRPAPPPDAVQDLSPDAGAGALLA